MKAKTFFAVGVALIITGIILDSRAIRQPHACGIETGWHVPQQEFRAYAPGAYRPLVLSLEPVVYGP